MKKGEELTAEYLNSRLDYDPDTGMLIWKYHEESSARWNARYAHKYAGTLAKDGFIRIGLHGKTYMAHRLIWIMMTGRYPHNEVRHLNYDGYDNRWFNLYCYEDEHTIGGTRWL